MAKIAFLILSLNILQTFVSVAGMNPIRNISHLTGISESYNYDKFHLSNVTIPLHYDLKLILINNNNFYGEVNISLVVTGRTKNITFHSELLGINYQTILLYSENGTIYRPYDSVHHIETQVNEVYFHDWLPENQVCYILISYTGTMSSDPTNTKGLFKFSYVREGIEQIVLYTTIFHGMGARRVFPCWDEPSVRTTFSINVKHPQKYTVLSNLEPQARIEDIGGMTWTHFDATGKVQFVPRIPPYHIAIVLYDSKQFFNIKSSYIANSTLMIQRSIKEENVDFAANIAEKVLQYMIDTDSNITSWYLPKHIAIMHYVSLDVTENNAVMFYRAQDIVFDSTYDALYHKLNIARTVSRKVAYHWLGNAFVPHSWSHLWISEAMCVLFGLNALTEIDSLQELRVMDYSIAQMQHDSFHLDADHVMNPLMMDVGPINIDDLFSFQYHLKGPLMLRMIETVLTRRTFWAKVKEYLDKQTVRYAVSETFFQDFWEYMQGELEDFYIDNHLSFVSLSKTMRSWSTSTGYPVLIVKRDYESGRTSVQLLQSSYKTAKSQTWYIHVTYATESVPEFTYDVLSTKARWFVASPHTEYTFDIENVDDWIIINLRQTGYYRVMYDERNWMRLGRFLKNCEYRQIHVLNRAQIVDDAYYFMTEGYVTFSQFQKLTEWLAVQETDYVAWYPMLKAFEYMSGFLPYPESEGLQIWMDSILKKALNRLKYLEQSHDDEFVEYLKQELIRWACNIKNPLCRGMAFNQLAAYAENPKSYEFPRGMKELIICNGLGITKFRPWYNILDMWKINRDSKILQYLSCADDITIIYNYLNLLESDSNITKLEPPDHVKIFFFVVRRHAQKDVVLNYILANLQILKPKLISKVAAFTVIINYVYTEKQLERIKEAAHDTLNGQNLQNIKSKIEERLCQIKHQIERFHVLHRDFLHEHNNNGL